MLRSYLYEAANVMLTRVARWSALMASGLRSEPGCVKPRLRSLESLQFILRGAFGFLFRRGAAGLSGNRARHAGIREHFEVIDLFGFLS